MQNEISMTTIDQTTDLPQSMPDTTDDEAALEMAALAAIFAAEFNDDEDTSATETEATEASEAEPEAHIDIADSEVDAPITEAEEVCASEDIHAVEAEEVACADEAEEIVTDAAADEPVAEADTVISDAAADEFAVDTEVAEETAVPEEEIISDNGAAEEAAAEFDEDEEFCPVIIPEEFDEDDEFVSVAIADDIDDYDSNDRTEEDYVRPNATRIRAQIEMESRASSAAEKKKVGFFGSIKSFIDFHKQFFTVLLFVLVLAAFLLYTRLF